MRQINKSRNDTYHVIGEKRLETRIHKLIRFSYAKVDSGITHGRSPYDRMLSQILAQEKTIGTIEWWEKGGIIHKPRVPVEIIVVSVP